INIHVVLVVNAFCGLRNKDIGSAAVAIAETTHAITRYASSNAEHPCVWYDIPDWQYFNAGFYVLFDNHFTMTDVVILTNCGRSNIPTYIVRFKAGQHIRNLIRDMEYDSEDDEQKKLYQTARKQFIEETRRSI
ncbi:hypothetical protein M405DRAFT_926168, partial [Rhizopogon salebrosus TDB-379]